MIACLLVPSLALSSELEERPALLAHTVVLTDERGLRVADATAEARARGIRAGMSLREAISYCPALEVLEPRPARVARHLDRLAAALHQVSPLVEVPSLAAVMSGRGEALYADLRGTEQMFPTPDHVARTVLTAIAPPGARAGDAGRGAGRSATPRLGLAAHRFTATAAARHAPPGGMYAVPGDGAAPFLAGLSADWLPLDPDALEHLRLLGLWTIGAFAALPRHAVEAQFGIAGGRAWLAAHGEDSEPVHAGPLDRERVTERVQALPPLVSREAVQASVEQLLGRALRHRRVERRFVRSLRLRAVTEDDRLWERWHVMKEPSGDRGRLWTAIRPLLEHAEYPGPIAELELELSGLTAESARQPDLFLERTRRREQLDEMVRHLKLRYGQSPVARIVDVEPWSRLPERRHALLEYDP